MRFGAVFDVQVPLLLLYRYRDAECMQKDVAWLCMVLGSYPVLPDVHMHMCIMKASTGAYMHIEEQGYVQRYLARRWRDARGEIATFRPQV